VQETLPLLSGGQTQSVQGAMANASKIIQSRQTGNRGISTGNNDVNGVAGWAKPFASTAMQQAKDDVSGFKSKSFGLLIGADSEYSTTTRLGAALVYAQSQIDSEGGAAAAHKATVDSYQAVLYGTYVIDAVTEFFWQGDLGWHRNDGQRKISFGGLNRTANVDYDSYSAHLGAGVARTFQLDERTTLAPTVRGDYLYFHERGYTETGAESLNLQVASKTTDQLTLRVEGKLTHFVSDQLSVLANAGFGIDVLSNASTLRASYVGGGAAFNTPMLESGRVLGNAGLGIVNQFSNGLELTLRYDLEGRDNYLQHTASAKLRARF
jgi:outer membrane autotransporter protein